MALVIALRRNVNYLDYCSNAYMSKFNRVLRQIESTMYRIKKVLSVSYAYEEFSDVTEKGIDE